MKTKRILVLLMACILCLSVFASCKNDKNDGEQTEDDVYYAVSFNTGTNEKIEPKLVKKGSSVDEPPVPIRDGYVFDGWYNGTRSWDFGYTVKENMTLTAHWTNADNVFKYSPAADGETAVITGIKDKSEEIRIPTYIGGYRVVAIGDGAFGNLSSESVSKVVVPDGVTAIGKEAFANSPDVEIVIEGTVSQLGERAFFGCTGLKAIKLGGGIETVTAEAFVGSGLESIALPESVRVVDENAFSECAALKALFIYSSIEAINDMAFQDTGVTAIFFYGTDGELTDVLEEKISDNNDKLISANHYIYSENEPAEGVNTVHDGFWYFNEKGQTRLWK